MALALGVQSSVIPWGNVVTQVAGHPLSYTAVTSPVVSPWPLGGSVVVGHSPAVVPAAIPAAVHAAVPAAVPAAVHAGIPAVVGHAGHAGYVAQTCGAVHSAPLAGHLNSVANINVAPAPGTH